MGNPIDEYNAGYRGVGGTILPHRIIETGSKPEKEKKEKDEEFMIHTLALVNQMLWKWALVV